MKRLKSYSPYVECPACHTIVNDTNHKLIALDEPAPCCGATGEPRIMYPSLEVLKSLELVDNQDLNSSDELKVAIVFLCTALELLLENSLWKLLQLHTKSPQLLEFVLDSNRGRERRIQLYNKLSDRTLADLFNSCGLLTLLEEWTILSDLRNNVVHRQHLIMEKEKAAAVLRSVFEKCLPAFVAVHNDVQRRIRASNK